MSVFLSGEWDGGYPTETEYYGGRVRKTNYTAIYNRKPIYRGDTLDPMRLTLVDKDLDEAIVPTSLCVQIRSSYGKLLADVGWRVEGDKVVIEAVPPEITRTFPVGKHKYDVEYTLPNGVVRTYVSGSIEILRDFSTCQAN